MFDKKNHKKIFGPLFMESLHPKHLLTLGRFPWVFRWNFVHSLQTKLVVLSGGGGFVAFSWTLVPRQP